MVSYVFTLIFAAIISQVHSLNVRPCGRLPLRIYFTTAVYDGSSDSVFVLGGKDGMYNTADIFKYDINSHAVEVVGKFPYSVAMGAAAIDKNGDIYYVGGGPIPIEGYSPNYIHKFSTKDSKASTIFILNKHYWPGGSSAVNIDDFIYIIGGEYGYSYQYAFRYHIPTNTFGYVTKIPGGLSATSVVYNGKHIYALGGNVAHTASDVVVKFDPATQELNILNVTLPQTRAYANALLVGDMAYLIGGRDTKQEIPKTATLFNVTDETITETIVKSPFPLPSRAGAVYVEKKNEILMFGGFGETGPSDDILCIDFKN